VGSDNRFSEQVFGRPVVRINGGGDLCAPRLNGGGMRAYA